VPVRAAVASRPPKLSRWLSRDAPGGRAGRPAGRPRAARWLLWLCVLGGLVLAAWPGRGAGGGGGLGSFFFLPHHQPVDSRKRFLETNRQGAS
jgi:hypothetical protein